MHRRVSCKNSRVLLRHTEAELWFLRFFTPSARLKARPRRWIRTAPSWAFKAAQLQPAEHQKVAVGRVLPSGVERRGEGVGGAQTAICRVHESIRPPCSEAWFCGPRFWSGMKTEEQQHVSLHRVPIPPPPPPPQGLPTSSKPGDDGG